MVLCATQDLVMAARGKLQERTWRRSDGTAATIDDISVTVVPIKAYKEEYAEWKAGIRERLEKGEADAAAATEVMIAANFSAGFIVE